MLLDLLQCPTSIWILVEDVLQDVSCSLRNVVWQFQLAKHDLSEGRLMIVPEQEVNTRKNE